MAILEQHFYHKTIRLYTAVFGTLFNELKIYREEDNKYIKVPLSYAGDQKHNVRNQQNPDPNARRYKMRTPRMAFRLVGWQKDDARITNRNHKLQNTSVNRDTVNGVSSQYNRVPYNFQYELRVKVKFMDDLNQIVEQILAYFNPSISIKVTDNPDMQGDTALQISLMDSNMEDQFEGDFEESRLLEASFNFELKGYIYLPTSDSSIIKEVTINYYDLNNPEELIDQQIFDSDEG